jgi:3-methyladenine DNA glycosylase AlkD
MSNIELLRKEMKKASTKSRAKALQRFFKTEPGEYGQGDIFLGLSVPQTRLLAKKFSNLDIFATQELLDSEIHEERLIALLILVNNYQKSSEEQKYKILNFYLQNTKQINNWDLVDLTAHKILGHYLENKPKDILYQLARSSNLWEKRISIISTAHFINNNQFQDTLDIAEILLFDSHDLIHKAVGWMLREIGKRDLPVLETFLKRHYKKMPRTMLRYAIEKFPETKRQRYLKGKIKITNTDYFGAPKGVGSFLRVD